MGLDRLSSQHSTSEIGGGENFYEAAAASLLYTQSAVNSNRTLSQTKQKVRTYTGGCPLPSICAVAHEPLTHSRKHDKCPGEPMPLFCRHLENCLLLLCVKDHTWCTPTPDTPAPCSRGSDCSSLCGRLAAPQANACLF